METSLHRQLKSYYAQSADDTEVRLGRFRIDVVRGDELIEILDGLEEGEEVVTGSYRAISKDLVNGAVVTVENEEKDAGGEHARGSGE